MTDPNKYYITISNFKKMVFSSQIMIEKVVLETYKEVYDKADLSKYINHKEIKNLSKYLLFLEKTEEYLIKTEKNIQSKKPKLNNLNSNSKYIFVAGPPKYHLNDGCKTLLNNFNNFEIPEEIRSRGMDDIVKFRKFAYENKGLINEGKEDVFLLRLKSQFNLKSNIGKIEFSNSGKIDVSGEENAYCLDKLESKIELKIKKIESFRETEDGRAAIKSYLYASVKNLTSNENLKKDERDLLECKKDLINLILDYLVNKYKSNGTTFSENLLVFYGFEPCGKCCTEKLDLYF